MLRGWSSPSLLLRKAKEEAERQQKEEEVRKAKEEAERLRKEEEERKAKEEAERLAKEEEERKVLPSPIAGIFQPCVAESLFSRLVLPA